VNVQPAPDFTLEHIEGHSVSLSDYRGRLVVVALSGRHSAEQMLVGVKALRRSYDHEQLPVLAVAAMGNIPRPARRIVKRKLKGHYDDAVKEASADLQAQGKPVPPGSQLVVMLPDWEGNVASGFGIDDVEHEAFMVLIDADGNVVGYGRGAQAAEQILARFA
jgi:cytochrome oxidase Cu insertion factor (SCO1/SenC/PrrC family)